MTTCMYCGGQTADGSKFCELCGAALPVEAAVSQVADDAVVQEAVVLEQAPAQLQQEQAYWQGTPDQAPEQAQQPNSQTYQQPFGQPQPAYAPQPAVTDSGSIGWGILGFFFPIVGLVLFLVWRNTKPKSAKVAGIGALVGFLLNLGFLLLS